MGDCPNVDPGGAGWVIDGDGAGFEVMAGEALSSP